MYEDAVSGNEGLPFFNADTSPAVPALLQELIYFLHFM